MQMKKTPHTTDHETWSGPTGQSGRSNRIKQRAVRLAVAAITTAALLPAVALTTAAPAAAEGNGLALTPPMGFNDWNAFKCNVSASLIEQTADTMVSSGMAKAGYKYVNIDDCWLSSARAADGSLVADPTKFPDGIKAVADYVHARGLKLGIYEDAGTMTCAGYPGSLGHEQQDAATFASWGVDYLKYDQCNIPFDNYPGMTHQQIDTQLYTTMSKALKATGRPIVFSMCNGTDSEAHPWLWGAPVSNLWRTTTDIQDSFSSMAALVAQNAQLAQYAKPGAWNDPDMLEIGNGGMTNAEYRSEMSLWSEMAAPLISGTDLTNASAATLKIYTNKDVIAIDQDKLGKQGRLLSSTNGHDVFAKPLANGDVAVALFNASDSASTISTSAQAVGLPHDSVYSAKDLWSKKVTESAGRIGAYVPAHATVMYRVSAPSKTGPTQLKSPMTELGITSSANPIDVGGKSTVTVTFTDDGRTPVTNAKLALTAPSGWSLTRTKAAKGSTATSGHALSATYVVTAPAKAAPISLRNLHATATYRAITGRMSSSSALGLTLISPVQSPYLTANTTGDTAEFGQSGDKFAVTADGAGVSPTTTTKRGTTAAVDQYAAIYQHGVAGNSATAETTVTAQAAGAGQSASKAKAGLMMRNDVTSPSGSPEGVVLYVTGSGTVAMSWNAGGGATVDTSSTASAAQTYPVHLRLVRNGTSYTGYWSTDGSTWTSVGTATVAAAAASGSQDVGLFHTSGDPTTRTEADFTGLTIS
jgi:alpha-galactosidase